jgi:Zn-dependent protease with chaperone function
MQALTISEFRAVLAHEFGHFYTGDTRLGPRVYKTRAAMVRVFRNLGSDSVVVKILTRFIIAQLAYLLIVGILAAYWKVFLRVTQLISRRQEARADELACHIAGSSALIEGLKKMRITAALLPPYWQSVVTPALAAGYVPPVADGLARFMATPSISQRSSEFISRALQNSKADAYDTHPPLAARIEAASRIGAQGAGSLDLSPATGLLDNLDALEAALLAKLSPD